MRPALRRPWSSLRGWISRHPLLAGGGFGSGIFLLVGVAGMLAFLPGLRAWFAADKWPTTEAEITASRLLDGLNDRAVRPDFTFRYAWQGRVYTTEGYALLEVYTTSLGDARDVIQALPVGSRVRVLVNPERPGQAVLIRGGPAAVLLHVLPAGFFLLGLVGMFFTVITGLGWLDENSPHPFGRILRTGGGWIIQEKIMRPFILLIFGGVILGLGVAGVVYQNGVLVIFAAVMAWGIWRASRPSPESGPEESD
jgi:hypothetical protein